jgi:hypothetical protein
MAASRAVVLSEAMPSRSGNRTEDCPTHALFDLSGAVPGVDGTNLRGRFAEAGPRLDSPAAPASFRPSQNALRVILARTA